MPYLGEANVGGLLTEALTADVEAVLADETGLVRADAAVNVQSVHVLAPFPCLANPPVLLPSLLSRTLSAAKISCSSPRDELTRRGRPCRKCADASTRQTRATYLRLCGSCFVEGWTWKLQKLVRQNTRGRPDNPPAYLSCRCRCRWVMSLVVRRAGAIEKSSRPWRTISMSRKFSERMPCDGSSRAKRLPYGARAGKGNMCLPSLLALCHQCSRIADMRRQSSTEHTTQRRRACLS